MYVKRFSISIAAICLTLYSCVSSRGTIYSVTYIEPKKIFVLGNNNHEDYNVTVKNISRNDLKLFQMSKEGIKQAEHELKINQKLIILVDANNALYIENSSERKATVTLNINKNVNLSMGYK